MTVFAIAENFYIYRKTYSPVKAGLISSAQQGHPPLSLVPRVTAGRSGGTARGRVTRPALESRTGEPGHQ